MPFILTNISKFLRSWILNDRLFVSKCKKKKRKTVVLCSRPPHDVKLGGLRNAGKFYLQSHFPRRSIWWRMTSNRLTTHTSPKNRLKTAVFYTLFFHRLTKVFVTKKTQIVWSGFKHMSTLKVSERCVIGFYRQHPLQFTAIYVIWRGTNFYYLLINFAGLT